MKKILTFAILAGIMFFVAGCGKKDSAAAENSHCEVSGNRINLRNVKVISSGIESSYHNTDPWTYVGPIERYYERKSYMYYRAYIAFDDHKVYLHDLEHYQWSNKLEEVQKQFESLR